MRDDRPYLSVVVTTRNDDHGRNLLQRTQIFVDGLAAQANVHGVDIELVIVEWNPPENRPPLADVLRWPEGENHFEARIVTVPSLVHRSLANSARLPLFQMIAKNVGIRRARGRFVVATNIDLLFSDELMAFLARKSLRPDRLYRVDRWDVAAEIPTGVAITEQLAWCDGNLVRICRRMGTFDLRTGDFHRIYESARVPLWVAPALRAGRYVDRSVRGAILHAWYFAVGLARAAVRVLQDPAVVRRAWLRRERAKQRHVRKRRRLPRLSFKRVSAAFSDRLSAVRLLAIGERARMRLHTNACGDFTLMAREAWVRAGGYPELEIFSMHIDSLMLYQAHYAGISEHFLPYRVYHIEHDDGFKPDKKSLDQLNTRLERAAIPQISNDEFLESIVEMYKSKRPKFHNSPAWGFAGETFDEILVATSSLPAARVEAELIV